MQKVFVALAVVVVVAVAGATWMVTRGGDAEDRLLVVDEEGAVSLVDPETGASLFQVAGATPTPDRSALLTTDSANGRTHLKSHDPITGAVTGTTTLDGELTIRTVSPQGRPWPTTGSPGAVPGSCPIPPTTRRPSPRASRNEGQMTWPTSRMFDLAGSYGW